MRFRLVYQGDLLSSQPPKDGQPDKRAAHKHVIRRCFHKQLKVLWETTRFLRIRTMDAASFDVLPEGAPSVWGTNPAHRMPMATALGEIYGHSGYKFAPLAWKEAELMCSLRFLCLRRDGKDAVLPGRDIDNRIKTVVDALTMPSLQQGCPLAEDRTPLAPQDGETPFYVLLDDDRRVTHLEVESDTLLYAPPDKSEAYVYLTVLVEIRPSHFSMFNQSWA